MIISRISSNLRRVRPASSEITTPFITTWRTTGSTESIELPYLTGGTYSGTIDWGDGSTSENSYVNRQHTYTNPGDYIVTISGVLSGWKFDYVHPTCTKIREVNQWGIFDSNNESYVFGGCDNLNLSGVTDTLKLVEYGITNLQGFFSDCYAITTINNIEDWNVSNVTTMMELFYAVYSFNQDISGWNVSNVTDMNSMFDNASSFNQPLNSWDVLNVTNMAYMFQNATSFNQSLYNWNVSNVTNMNSMFIGTTSFNQSLNSWDVSNVIDMGFMFAGSHYNQPLSGWNVSNVTDFSYMFSDNDYFNQPINTWVVSSATVMDHMFYYAYGFNQDISSWNISNVTSFSNFMTGKADLNYSYLDDIYTKWSLLTVQPNVNADFGSITYCDVTSGTPKSILTNAPNNWIITDGGISC